LALLDRDSKEAKVIGNFVVIKATVIQSNLIKLATGSDPLSNNIARIHEITPFDDRVATVKMQNPLGFVPCPT